MLYISETKNPIKLPHNYLSNTNFWFVSLLNIKKGFDKMDSFSGLTRSRIIDVVEYAYLDGAMFK